MIVYLVRHGIAIDRDHDDVSSDEQRWLTKKGRYRTTQVAHGLKVLGCRPDTILSSPLVRAVQTAKILYEVLGTGSSFEESSFLRPDVPIAKAMEWVSTQQDASIMLVGHMPDIAALASEMIGGTGNIRITMKKAAVCAISFTDTPRPGKGRLEWLMQPNQLRSLADLK